MASLNSPDRIIPIRFDLMPRVVEDPEGGSAEIVDYRLFDYTKYAECNHAIGSVLLPRIIEDDPLPQAAEGIEAQVWGIERVSTDREYAVVPRDPIASKLYEIALRARHDLPYHIGDLTFELCDLRYVGMDLDPMAGLLVPTSRVDLVRDAA